MWVIRTRITEIHAASDINLSVGAREMFVPVCDLQLILLSIA
jgi:hypothetical protein